MSAAPDVSGIAAGQLKSIVERIENLLAERKALGDDIKQIYEEASGNGFNVKIIREVIKLRARDRAEIDEEATLLELYLQALGEAP